LTFAPAVEPGFLRRNRSMIGIAVALLVVLSAFAVLTSGGKVGTLDPDAYDPSGAHALAVLLEGQGVTVQRTVDVPGTRRLAGPTTTTFVPQPELLSDEELEVLGDLPGDLVIAGAGPRTLSLVDQRIGIEDVRDSKTRSPGCSLREATNAGRALSGGPVYSGPGTHCYGATVVDLPDSDLLIVGDAELMTNGELAKEGNAALAVGLLSRLPTVLWLIPDPNRPDLGLRPVQSPNDLLPPWVKRSVVQLGVALLLLALWRARRLGRVVPEPLPVVVRAGETVEGRGRLYRAASARDRAADELRAGAVRRLGPRVGVGRHPTQEALVTGLAQHTGRTDEELAALLYGPQPADDAALVRLADEIDALTREVTGP
jgi:hypothetical protein